MIWQWADGRPKKRGENPDVHIPQKKKKQCCHQSQRLPPPRPQTTTLTTVTTMKRPTRIYYKTYERVFAWSSVQDTNNEVVLSSSFSKTFKTISFTQVLSCFHHFSSIFSNQGTVSSCRDLSHTDPLAFNARPSADHSQRSLMVATIRAQRH